MAWTRVRDAWDAGAAHPRQQGASGGCVPRPATVGNRLRLWCAGLWAASSVEGLGAPGAESGGREESDCQAESPEESEQWARTKRKREVETEETGELRRVAQGRLECRRGLHHAVRVGDEEDLGQPLTTDGGSTTQLPLRAPRSDRLRSEHPL